MKKNFVEFIVKLFGKNSDEVIRFFQNDIPKEKLFENEKDFVNHIITILSDYCSVLEKDEIECLTFENEEFWSNKKIALSKVRDSNTVTKSNLITLLYVTRLIARVKEQNKLTGDLKDFSKYLEDFKKDVIYILSEENK